MQLSQIVIEKCLQVLFNDVFFIIVYVISSLYMNLRMLVIIYTYIGIRFVTFGDHIKLVSQGSTYICLISGGGGERDNNGHEMHI